MFKDDQRSRIGNVVAKALTDATFRAELLANPADALTEHGIQIPEGVEVRFVENTESTIYLTLPYLEKLSSEARLRQDRSLEGRAAPIIQNTPKDVGCCGGGSSIGATWLEDRYDGVYESREKSA